MSAEEPNRPACAGHDPELFFPIGISAASARSERADYRFQVAYAKSVCAGCPIQAACLERHLTEPEGIFGGTTPYERQVLRWGDGRRTRRSGGVLVRSDSHAAMVKRDYRERKRRGLTTTRPLSMTPEAVRERAYRARRRAEREGAAA